MNSIDDVKFYTGPYGYNRWLALSYHSLYFCFEAESEEALIAKCKRAIAFCRKAVAFVKADRERTVQLFQPTRVISARELEDA
jgi:hypothetical protein